MQSKYWIDLTGYTHLVCIVGEGPQISHEEWAYNKKQSLEKLLEKGWVRVQDITPDYLYVDCLKINQNQIKALQILLQKEYAKIVIEINDKESYFNNVTEAKEFLETVSSNRS